MGADSRRLSILTAREIDDLLTTVDQAISLEFESFPG